MRCRFCKQPILASQGWWGDKMNPIHEGCKEAELVEAVSEELDKWKSEKSPKALETSPSA